MSTVLGKISSRKHPGADRRNVPSRLDREVGRAHNGIVESMPRRHSMTEEFKSAKEVARALGTDARTLRKFLRSGDSPFEAVGQGGRYNFDDEDVKLLEKAFNGYLRKKKTPTKPKTIELDTPAEEELSDSDFDLDFGEFEEIDDDIEE
jgi:hypothetical protein